jgi:hypothetical protein
MSFKPSPEQRVLVYEMLMAGAVVSQIVPHIKDRSSGRPVSLAVFRKAFGDELRRLPYIRYEGAFRALMRDAAKGDAVAQTVYIEHFSPYRPVGEGYEAIEVRNGVDADKLTAKIGEWRRAAKKAIRKEQRANRYRKSQ